MGGKYDKEYSTGDPGGCGPCKGTGQLKKFFGGIAECHHCDGTGIRDGRKHSEWDMDDVKSGKPGCDHDWGPGSSDMKRCRKCSAQDYR